jgi:hypothetical protein
MNSMESMYLERFKVGDYCKEKGDDKISNHNVGWNGIISIKLNDWPVISHKVSVILNVLFHL